MSTEEIVAKFADALNKFEPIEGQPSDVDLTQIREALTPLLIQIAYDELRGKHNLVGLIMPSSKYIKIYRTAFAPPTKVGACDATVAEDVKPAIRARVEAEHKAKKKDRAAYETALRERTLFVLNVVEDAWVREPTWFCSV